jgi:sulfur transfer complex TusBCD TusB component (DsrH family)
VLGEMTLTPQASDEEGEEEEFCLRLANDKLDFLLVADGCFLSLAHTFTRIWLIDSVCILQERRTTRCG